MREIYKQLETAQVIRGSVGEKGNNAHDDVQLVQLLLNEWLSSRSLQAIAVDGIAGPKTIGAIKKFQQAGTGRVTGRCDPNGPSIRHLARHQFQRLAENVKVTDFVHAVQIDNNSRRRAVDFSGDKMKEQIGQYWAVWRGERSAKRE